MIQMADLREWRGHRIVDPEGHKIGTLEAVYVHTSNDEPSMATVETGRLANHRLVFVPLGDATVGPDYVQVPYSKAMVHGSPSIGTDDILPAEDEEAIFTHYNLTYQTGTAGERQLARR
ncbi:MAG TPA: PRC-barrel domain-containing protein [Actinocrinis sp.]|jgi:sporulation protein YlmC with PRC-barrel domain|nr:PRC-barrel domain-containing protein [Actinocrinis sp.]